MVIFNSYVSLPEGIDDPGGADGPLIARKKTAVFSRRMFEDIGGWFAKSLSMVDSKYIYIYIYIRTGDLGLRPP